MVPSKIMFYLLQDGCKLTWFPLEIPSEWEPEDFYRAPVARLVGAGRKILRSAAPRAQKPLIEEYTNRVPLSDLRIIP